MPAHKPPSLNKRKDSKQARAARVDLESMVTPATELTIDPPVELKDKKIACSVWVRVLTLQSETQAAKDGAPIITAFDERSLIMFCKMVEEERILETKLSKLDKAQDELHSKVNKIKPTKDNLKDYLSLWAQFNGLTSNFKGMSARLDAHRSSMHEIAKSMYLTPASRAGVSPTQKEPEAPPSEMEKVLNG